MDEAFNAMHASPGGGDVKVKGVREDLPLNTSFHDIRFFAPFDLTVMKNPCMKEQGRDNGFLLIDCELADNTGEKPAFAQTGGYSVPVIVNGYYFR